MTSLKRFVRMLREVIPMLRWGTARYFLAVYCAACLICSGCIAPIPMTKRTSGPTGKAEKRKIDLTFVQPGITTQEEVVQKLGWVDSGIKEDRLFVARWASSGSGWLWFVPGDCTPWCDDNQLSRDWTVHNLIVDFDEAGRFIRSRDVPSTELAASLEDWIARGPSKRAELPTSVELNAYHLRPRSPIAMAKLMLSADSFRYQDLRRPEKSFRIRAAAIKGIASEGDDSAGSGSSLAQVTVSIVFREKTPAGEHITLKVLPTDLLTLIKYVHAAKGPSHAP